MRGSLLVAVLLLGGCDYDECVDKCEQHFEACGNDHIECDLDSAGDGDTIPTTGICPNVEGGVCDKLYARVTKYHECVAEEGCHGDIVEGTPCYAAWKDVEDLRSVDTLDCYDW